jgi:hypothetical protein
LVVSKARHLAAYLAVHWVGYLGPKLDEHLAER